VAGEGLEQLELTARRVQRPAAARGDMAARVDDELAEDELGAHVAAVAAQECVQARGELGEGERLAHRLGSAQRTVRPHARPA
jgi:hypothetical protein